MSRPAIHQPIFPDDCAQFIIWCRPTDARLYTIAAGPLDAMMAAWDVLVTQYPRDELTLQQGARTIRSRSPLLFPESFR